MIIELCIPDMSAYQIAIKVFKKYPEFQVVQKNITQASHPIIVSPGNSFGEMNGGVDGIINTMLSAYDFESRMGDRIKGAIDVHYFGELPVGSALIINVIGHPTYKSLIYTPTMRVAEPVESSINAYLAFRAALCIMAKSDIKNISTPLFCTGAGNMPVERACKQMLEAYKTIKDNTLQSKDWQIYHNHHRMLKSL